MIDGVEENERKGRGKRNAKEWRLLKRPDGSETRLLLNKDNQIREKN